MTEEVKGFEDTIKWYNANAEQYADNIESIPSIELINRFVKIIGHDGKILDAGCAAGRDCRLFKDGGLEPIGVDLSEPLLEEGRKRNPDIEFKNENFLNLSFEDESFDGVWAHASLLHFETTKQVVQVLREFNRILKKGGVLHVFVKQQQGDKKTEVVKDKLSGGHDRFFQWFTKSEIGKYLKDTGFKIVKLQDNYQDPAGREEVKWVVALAKKD